ncbi:hypothetical protein G5B00_09065 [Parapedobacter sp. SGR-10]|uniref:hypothetical protein n=1 Tax=Parapedobacter sp. SGR-10 TaxID=2710879 RepID=UPI0013D7BD1A|nr:hypothetical protein [Parapedobacter sp. SGR-10]NGF56666.1 hypothetical protein [Parapedobacter sp. SGR-10]
MDTQTLNRRKKIAIIVTLILFFLSLVTKVYRMEDGDVNPTGFEVFIAGWMAIFNFDFYWLANPISVLAIIFFLFSKIRVSLVLSSIALILAVAFFIYVKVGDGTTQYGTITSMGLGYYFWLASILTVFVSSVQLLRYSK